MIRVFIVDDDDTICSVVKSMLDMEPDMAMVGSYDKVEGALEKIEFARPSIVLLDVQLPDGKGMEIASALRLLENPPGVIMISVQKDITFLKEAMNAGARDYLLKPFSSEDLYGAIRKLADDMTISRRGPQVLGIWGCRGGAGSTSLSISLSRILKEIGYKVALVDGDLYLGDIAFLMNVVPERDWADWGRDGGEVAPEKYLLDADGVSIMAAPMHPAQADVVKSGMVGKLISGLLSYDLVIVDLPRSLGEITVEMAERCDHLWLVTDMSCSGVKNLRLFISLLGRLRLPASDISVVLNFFSRPYRDTVRKLQSEFSIKAVLPEDDSVEKGWIDGKGASSGLFGSSYGKAVKELASSLKKEGVL